jgi:hypothetical protein
VVIIDWAISDDLRLRSGREGGGLPFSGTELIWSYSNEWEFALGATYRHERRFRLDDSGIAPDGVGRMRSWPMWVRAGWKPTSSARIDAFLGILLSGELRLEDDDGRGLAEDDVEPMPALGIAGQVRF